MFFGVCWSISTTPLAAGCLSSPQLDMSRGPALYEADLKWQTVNNTAGIEGLDRRCRTGAWQTSHYPESDTQSVWASEATCDIVCCRCFHHKAEARASDTLCDVSIPGLLSPTTEDAWGPALCVIIKCAVHWHHSCLHIPCGGPLSLQHPAPRLHNATWG